MTLQREIKLRNRFLYCHPFVISNHSPTMEEYRANIPHIFLLRSTVSRCVLKDLLFFLSFFLFYSFCRACKVYNAKCTRYEYSAYVRHILEKDGYFSILFKALHKSKLQARNVRIGAYQCTRSHGKTRGNTNERVKTLLVEFSSSRSLRSGSRT